MSAPETPPSDADAVTSALARIHTLPETIVRAARERVERTELIDALARIANDAESSTNAHGVVPF